MAAQTLTTAQLQKGFACGHMTIYNWKQGTATKDPLPFEKDGESGRVTYALSKVKAWAKKHGVGFSETEALKVEAGSKRGPKPAAKKTAAPAKKPTISKSRKAKFAKAARAVESMAAKVNQLQKTAAKKPNPNKGRKVAVEATIGEQVAEANT